MYKFGKSLGKEALRKAVVSFAKDIFSELLSNKALDEVLNVINKLKRRTNGKEL